MKKSARPNKKRRQSHPQPEPSPQVYYFDCKSDQKEIRRIEPFLVKMNEVARLDDGTFYRLLVAGTEAVNNGILHGNKGDKRKFVHVTCVISKDSLVFRVKDEGRGFNPEDVPDPLEEKNLLKTSGRGIFLMRSLMDKVSYKMTADGTEVELVIDLKHHG
jgi:serine/threonine-protein kinase RsbW